MRAPFDWPAVANASGGDGSDIGAFERGLPALTIIRSGNQVTLSWPASELAFRLQSAATTNDFLGNSTFPLNALLGPCQDNGCPVWTMCPLPGSPARDKGKSDLATDA